MARKKVTRTWSTVISLAGTALVVAAIVDQLRLPPEERTWQGHIFGIPYDFRFPTIERIREKVWNKDTSRIITPQVFGVGWSINLYPLLHPEARTGE
jgi:hypothetical protein